MIVGLGTDLCPPVPLAPPDRALRCGKARAASSIPKRLVYLLNGNRERLPERLAGRWALREAFGKALGMGLDGWAWKELRYVNGRLWTVGSPDRSAGIPGHPDPAWQCEP